MARFCTILVLVQVLSVLASGDMGAEDLAKPEEAQDMGGLEDVADGSGPLEITDYHDDEICSGLRKPNDDLVAVFADITGGMRFNPDCLEITFAAQYGGSSYTEETTHLIQLEKNVTSLSDVDGVKREFGPVLKNRLEEAGLGENAILFGCAPGKDFVICYYRKEGVKVLPMEEGEEEENVSSGGSGGEAESGEGQGSVSEIELM